MPTKLKQKQKKENPTTTQGLLDYNFQRLRFLPQVLIGLVILGIVGIGVWFLTPNQYKSQEILGINSNSPLTLTDISQEVKTIENENQPQENSDFDTNTAFAQKKINGTTYFLDDGCQGPRTTSCDLWERDTFTGNVKMIKSDVALTGEGKAFEINSETLLRFANLQDYEEGINFIYFNRESKSATLIRVSTGNTTFSITSTIELIPGENSYYLYI